MFRIKSVIFFYFLLISSFYAQGSIMLVGGGSENYGDWSDKPYKWFVEHAPNRKILVLHYETTTTFFTGYFPSLSPCSVTNLAINSTSQANENSVYELILQHDGIFLRGGDQAQYINKWKGTLAEKAIKEVYQRGGVIGGTSAGEMVLSAVSYTSGNTDYGQALRNPNTSITLIDDFLQLVPNALAESHTNERGRIGRLPVFLARYKNSTGKNIFGIGVDVNTALVIEKDGTAEVMGGSAVSFLNWNSNSTFSIDVGQPFSMGNMSFNQLLPGHKINLNTGEIFKPATAIDFSPKHISMTSGIIILDGSALQSDWSATNGSIKKLQSVLRNSNDVVGIFTSPSSTANANFINAHLSTLGVVSHVISIDDQQKNNSSLSALVSSCNAFVFIDNILDGLAKYLDSTTLVGNSFLSKITSGVPLLFLSDDVMLAGEKVIMGLYSGQYNAYYGTLTQADGLNLVKGIQLVPRIYQNLNNSRGYDYSENRLMGMFWSMAKSSIPYGLVIDAGTYVVLSNNQIEVRGVLSFSTPVMIFDARKVKWVDFPTFKRPGKPNPVQNAAMVGATFNIIRPGDNALITNVQKVESNIPESVILLKNYPNPFNPITTFRFRSDEMAKAKLKIFDILGKEVETVMDEFVDKGVYEKTWDGSKFSSGIYLAQLECISEKHTIIKSMKIVLLK